MISRIKFIREKKEKAKIILLKVMKYKKLTICLRRRDSVGAEISSPNWSFTRRHTSFRDLISPFRYFNNKPSYISLQQY